MKFFLSRLLLMNKALVNILVPTSLRNRVTILWDRCLEVLFLGLRWYDLKFDRDSKLLYHFALPWTLKMPFSSPCQLWLIEIFFFFLAYVMNKNQVFCFNLYFPDYVRSNIFSCAFWSFVLFLLGKNPLLAPLLSIVLFVRKKSK